jgi:hypothetical protein
MKYKVFLICHTFEDSVCKKMKKIEKKEKKKDLPLVTDQLSVREENMIPELPCRTELTGPRQACVLLLSVKCSKKESIDSLSHEDTKNVGRWLGQNG